MVTTTAAVGAGLGVAVVLTTALLAVERPPLDGATALAAFAWAVVAGFLHALAALGAYPPPIARFAVFPAAVAVAYVLGGLVWAVLLQLAEMRDVRVQRGRYLAAAGLGAAAVMLLALVSWRGLDGEGLLWLAATPLLAAMAAAVAFLALGVVDVTAVGATRLVGYAVVFAYALLGIGLAVTVQVFGAPAGGVVGRGLLELARRVPTAPALGSTWPAALGLALVGVVATVGLARVVRRSGPAGLAGLLSLGAAALGPAVGRLLVSVFG